MCKRWEQFVRNWNHSCDSAQLQMIDIQLQFRIFQYFINYFSDLVNLRSLNYSLHPSSFLPRDSALYTPSRTVVIGTDAAWHYGNSSIRIAHCIQWRAHYSWKHITTITFIYTTWKLGFTTITHPFFTIFTVFTCSKQKNSNLILAWKLCNLTK